MGKLSNKRPSEVAPQDHAMDAAVRPFEPWRYAKTDRAKALVRDLIVQLEETAKGKRQRKRKPREQATFEATVEALACDLAHLHLSASLDGPQRLTTTRSKRFLGSVPRRYRAPALTEQLLKILDRMHELAHHVQRKGDRSSYARVFTEELGERRARRATTIAVGPVLAWRMAHHGVTFEDLGVSTAGETIILKRGREDYWDAASPIDYAETSITRRYREELGQVNAAIATADLAVLGLPQVDASDRHMRRVFTYGSFSSGGRLAGGFWMPMEKELRLSRLRIGGERLASIDFNGLYPRLLYAREDKTPSQHDLYRFDGLEKYRKGMKRLLNARLFDRGERRSKPRRTPKEVREGVELYPAHCSIDDLLSVLNTVHSPIARYFGSGIGHELQFAESQIMMRTLLALEAAGIIGLPVHDCIVVPRKHVAVVTEIMGRVTMAEEGAVVPVTVDVVDEM